MLGVNVRQKERKCATSFASSSKAEDKVPIIITKQCEMLKTYRRIGIKINDEIGESLMRFKFYQVLSEEDKIKS